MKYLFSTTTLLVISTNITSYLAFNSPHRLQHRHPWTVTSHQRVSLHHAASIDSPTAESTTDSSTPTTTTPSKIGTKIITNLFNSFMQRDFTSAISTFAETFTYEDASYIKPITNNHHDLQTHFYHVVSLMPPNAQIVIDEIACNDDTGKVAAKWHLEQPNNKNGEVIIPFTNGCSFYTVDIEEEKITEGFKVTEMLIKTDEKFAEAVVGSAARFSGVADSLVERLQSAQQDTLKIGDDDDKVENVDEASSSSSSSSIIEKYYDAWNNRDMELALTYFDENCTVQTEDPIFVRTLSGKDQLRTHLLENADSLPTSAKIICDDIAMDTSNGNYGVRWHLEVNGNALPGLRGCSLCTSDLETGLLTSCYDVTEAPVKLPRVSYGGGGGGGGSKYVFSNLMALSSKFLLNN